MEPTTNPNIGANTAKPIPHYGGTSPATTLAWAAAIAFVVFCWLAYAFRHYFGEDQFPQTSSAAQQQRHVAYAPKTAAP